MVKKILILCLILCSFFQLEAQEQGVQFQELTFQEALDKAKAENKLVFVDCYTSWCGPCKYMLNNVFVLPEVGTFFNDHFVNVKYDMEKGEGRYLGGRFRVRSYPTFLLIRPDGTVQHQWWDPVKRIISWNVSNGEQKKRLPAIIWKISIKREN